MSEEKVGLIFEASGYSQFNKAVKDSELALRRQARALDESARELQKEIVALKGVLAPNRELIAQKQRLLQQTRLNASETRASIAAMREEARAAKASAGGMQALGTAAASARGGVVGLVAALAALVGVGSAAEILKTADAFNQLQARVKGSLDDVNQFDDVFKKLIDSSNRSGAAIDGVAQAFVRLRPAAQELGASNDQLIKFNETFLKMGALAGATSEEVKNSMIQLSQGLASGALRGDELRSVMEQMPQVARTIAQSMGIPFREFKKAAEDGKITADQVFKAILSQADEVDAKFAQLPGSIERSINRLVNSVQLFIGALNDSTGVTKDVSKAIDDAAKFVDQLTNFVKENIGAFKDLFEQLTRVIGQLIELAIKLNPVLSSLDQLGKFLNVVGLNADNAASLMIGFTHMLDLIATKSEIAANELSRVRDAMINAKDHWNDPVAWLKADQATTAARDARTKEIERDFTRRQNERIYRAFAPKGTTIPSPYQNNKILNIPVPNGKKNKKKGPSQESIEKDRIQEIQKSFDDRIRLSRANSELNIAQMGPFAEDQAVLAARLKMEQETTGILNQQLLRLNNTTVKTKDAQKALRDAIAKTKLEMIDNAKAVQEAKNALDKYSADEGFQDFQRKQDYEAKRAEFIREQAIKGEEEQAQIEARLYKEKKININAYYDDVLSHINNKEQVEKEAHEALIQRLEGEIATRKELFKETEKSQSVKTIRAKIKEAQLAHDAIQADLDAERDKAKEEQDAALEDAATKFGDSLEQAISTGITSAFTDKGPLQAMKDFVKSLKDNVVKFLADALAEGMRRSPAFQAISSWFGNLFNNISERTSGGSAGGLGGLAGLLKGLKSPAGLAAVGTLAAAGGSALAGKSSSTLGQFGGVALGAGGGALAGAMIGQMLIPIPGVGAAIGAAAGGLFGGGAAVASTPRQGFIGRNKATIIGSILGGGLGFFIGRSMDKRRNAAIDRANYQQNKLAPFLSSVVSTAQANSNDLNILNAQFMAAARGMSGRGSNGMAMKRDAMTQILQLIEQRKKTIEDFIRDTARQNEELRDQIALADAKPFEKAALEHQIAIKQIEYERTQLLEQFKDSEEAKTKILEQESLKRQQLSQQESEKFKSDTQDLRELLMQRDDAANANVFTRLRSREQVKSDTLAQLDQQIAQKYLELKGQLAAGVTPKDTLGLNQILSQLNAIGTQNNNLQIIINQADDPNAVREEITRAFDAFFRKSMGANVA
jgi:tape measure domain-containing protein